MCRLATVCQLLRFIVKLLKCRVSGREGHDSIMAQKIISISLAEELLAKIDLVAEEDFTSRSDVIRQAVVERLKVIDEYRVRLAAAATNTDIPTEKEILRWLRIKAGQRWARNWRQDMRKS